MQFSVYQQTHIGGRKVNQDRMGYSFTRESLLLVLADGMGGHARGEVASTITLQTMSAMFQRQATPYIKGPERFLQDALLESHDAILRYGAQHGLKETPRTTVVACLVQHNCAIWAHCGDSRLYWVRGSQILARTLDHSHIEHLIAKGLAQPSERATHPDRNKLYNCLGATSVPKIAMSRQSSLQAGDVLLLCSDGLWGVLPDSEIVHQLSNHTIVRAVPDLIGMATTIAGAEGDNTTALAIMWQGADDGTDIEGEPSTISTDMLRDDEVDGTIDASAPAPVVADREIDVFDEDEIERAIAEIRGAIEKSSNVLK
ncbi:MAG TPA: PP2C family serine/threonine-protein phosphatase [Telluria sp.]|jgi:serine/threonine protein phosphatase PrpC